MVAEKEENVTIYEALDKKVRKVYLVELEERAKMFVKITELDLMMPDIDKETRQCLMGQLGAFGAMITLIQQLKKSGKIWTGGYLDNIGVVYDDQLQMEINKRKSKLGQLGLL